MAMQNLTAQIRHLPGKPGIYLFRDGKGTLLYVGKAINLKNRVTSYFRFPSKQRVSRVTIQPSKDLTPAKQLMVTRIHAIDTTIVSNETEALLLEAEFIKRYHPPYNIILADDKSYVYIKFDFDRSGYPDVYPIRRPVIKRKSRSILFGPYTSAMSAYTVLRLAKRIFPYCLKPPTSYTPPLPSEGTPMRAGGKASGLPSSRRLSTVGSSRADDRVSQKKTPATSPRFRPCLNWHLHRCPGACMGQITPDAYEENLRRMIPLFQGKLRDLLKKLTSDMKTAAAAHAYETAALLRDQIRALNIVAEKQSIVDVRKESYDVIGFATSVDTSVVNVFRVRRGVLLERATHPLRHPVASPPEEIIESFLQQYYAIGVDAPRIVYAPFTVTYSTPYHITIIAPQRGKKRRLLRLSQENAEEELKRFTRLHALKQAKSSAALASLKEVLKLPVLPQRIEAYDISNVQGRHAVGAMTVLLQGQPAPREYRSFTIKTVDGSNDVAMLQEVLRRRLAHSAWPPPDLILIDGGKPQLSAAQTVLHEYKLNIPLLALAKGRGLDTKIRKQRGEELWFIPQWGTRTKPIKLTTDKPKPDHSSALLLLDRVRDEAHRFGITHYRAKHRKELTTTRLDDIPGIGPQTRRILLQAFGSLQGVRQAAYAELSKLLGAKKAQKLREKIDN